MNIDDVIEKLEEIKSTIGNAEVRNHFTVCGDSHSGPIEIYVDVHQGTKIAAIERIN